MRDIKIMKWCPGGAISLAGKEVFPCFIMSVSEGSRTDVVHVEERWSQGYGRVSHEVEDRVLC